MSELLANVMGNAALATGMPKMVRTRPEPERSEPVQAAPEESEEARQKRLGEGQPAQAAADHQPKRKLVRRRLTSTPTAGQGYRSSKSEPGPKLAEKTAPQAQRPKPQASSSSQPALWRLGSQAAVNRAGLGFEQSQQDTTTRNVERSREGKERTTLNNLARMMEISVAQHTGGKAGEASPRRQTREIYSALLGLKSSSPRRREENRGVRHTDAELTFKEGQARGLMAFLEPEPGPADYRPFTLVA